MEVVDSASSEEAGERPPEKREDMTTSKRFFRAVVAGAVFFAAFWIVEDLLRGDGMDRVVKTAIMAIMFAILSFFSSWIGEKLRSKRPRSLRDINVEIRRTLKSE